MCFTGATHHDIGVSIHSGEFTRLFYLLNQHCLFENYQIGDQSAGVASLEMECTHSRFIYRFLHKPSLLLIRVVEGGEVFSFLMYHQLHDIHRVSESFLRIVKHKLDSPCSPTVHHRLSQLLPLA